MLRLGNEALDWKQRLTELSMPPLSVTFTEAVRLMNQPELMEARRVAETIRRDPVVTVRILRIVNSAYYGLRAKVGTIEHAVVLLGAEAAVGFVVGMGMVAMRRHFPLELRRTAMEVIRHLIATGAIASQIAQLLGWGRKGIEFTAGLLHDVGKLALLYNTSSLYQEICEKPADAIPEAEEAHFGLHHAELGALLAEQWAFPAELVEAIRWHHSPAEASPEHRATAWIVHLADAAAYAFRLGGHQDGLARRNAFYDPASWEAFAEAVGRGLDVAEVIAHLENGQIQLHRFVEMLLRE
ncbi:MAG: HDOD domain-containing protein [Bacteroidota bacterium]|nr:HDOD domain-containing protein [Bacteroidota bacterium]MDW8137896.1 HDOD domain-containing protein [Bacteroidota bacterium]